MFGSWIGPLFVGWPSSELLAHLGDSPTQYVRQGPTAQDGSLAGQMFRLLTLWQLGTDM